MSVSQITPIQSASTRFAGILSNSSVSACVKTSGHTILDRASATVLVEPGL